MSSVDSATRFLRGRARAQREIVTPEGVTLSVELAEYGERATAFILDLFFWLFGSILVLLTVLVLAKWGVSMVFAISLMLFLTFIIRDCYFIYFELSWRGMTPGKRIVGIRVIDGSPAEAGEIASRFLAKWK